MDIQKRKQIWQEFLDLDSDVDRMVLIYCAQRSLKHQVDYREATVAQCTDWTLENFARQTETAELIPDHSIPQVKALVQLIEQTRKVIGLFLFRRGYNLEPADRAYENARYRAIASALLSVHAEPFFRTQ